MIPWSKLAKEFVCFDVTGKVGWMIEYARQRNIS